MCHRVTVLATFLILVQINAESTDDQQGFTDSNYYTAPTVNFHDIYTNNLDLISDEPLTSKDDDLHISNIISQSAEFHIPPQTDPPETTPRPMFIFNRSQLTKNLTITTSSTTTTTEESSIKVIPIKSDFQRGVLDLLFPATRVRTFKTVFDSVRRILSHTFRK